MEAALAAGVSAEECPLFEFDGSDPSSAKILAIAEVALAAVKVALDAPVFVEVKERASS